MSDFEDIQRLLRLKRHERPPEDFVEDFVRQFQHRQRQDLLRHSARGLLWERVSTYFEGIFAPKWRWAGAMAAVFLGAFLLFKPAPSLKGVAPGSDDFAVHQFDYNDKQAPISDAEVERYLISRHFNGGLADEPGVAQGQYPLLVPAPLQQPNLLPTNSYIRSDLEQK